MIFRTASVPLAEWIRASETLAVQKSLKTRH